MLESTLMSIVQGVYVIPLWITATYLSLSICHCARHVMLDCVTVRS